MPPPPLRALALIEEDCRLVAIYPLIGAMPARAGRKINRIEIGTQMMPGNTGELLGQQDMLCRQLPGLVQPPPNCGLGHAEMLSHGFLGREEIRDHHQGFVSGGCRHTLTYMCERITVNEKVG
jgi:hypothetical protein